MSEWLVYCFCEVGFGLKGGYFPWNQERLDEIQNRLGIEASDIRVRPTSGGEPPGCVAVETRNLDEARG